MEAFQENISLWRTSRAISTPMIFLGALLTLFGQGGNVIESALITAVIPLFLYLVSTCITLTIFARLCTMMCSLTYLSRHATTREA